MENNPTILFKSDSFKSDFDLNEIEIVDYIFYDMADNCVFCFKKDNKYVKKFTYQNYFNIKNEISKNPKLKFDEIIIGTRFDQRIALVNRNNILDQSQFICCEDGSLVLQIVFKSFHRIYANYNNLRMR